MKLRINEKTGFLIWMFGMLFFPFLFRRMVLPDLLAAGNVVSFLGVLIISVKTFDRKSRLLLFNILVIILASILLIINGDSTDSIARYFISGFLPILILEFKPISKDKFKVVFPAVLNMLDISIGIIFICAAIDLFSGWRISNYLANLYGVRSLLAITREGRLVSYFGHALLTSEMVLVFFIFHLIDEFYVRKAHKIVFPTIEAVFIMALTGSKTGIVLLAVLLLMFYGSKKTIKYIPLISVAIYLVYRFGIFDAVLSRFMIGAEQGDLTTGRLTAFLRLRNVGYLDFSFFSGHRSDLINSNTTLIAALENPVLRWAYRYGIAFAILMSIRVFVLPAVRQAKCNNIRIFICSLVYLVDIMTYDTVCSIGDNMLLYCTVIYILYCASSYAADNIGEEK